MLKYKYKCAMSAYLRYGVLEPNKVVIVPIVAGPVPDVPGVISFEGRVAVLTNTNPLTYQDMGHLVTVEEAVLHDR